MTQELSVALAVNETIFVDGATTVITANQDGGPGRPYKTIQQAINVVPTATTLAGMLKIYTIDVAPGFYDEDLTITITGKRILILTNGRFGLGTFGGSIGAPSGTLRSITISGSAAAVGGTLLGPYFGLKPNHTQPAQYPYAPYLGQYEPSIPQISGKIAISTTPAGSFPVILDLQAFIGGVTGVSIDATGTTGTVALLTEQCSFTGSITDPSDKISISYANKTIFGGAVRCADFFMATQCEFDGNVTVSTTAPPALNSGAIGPFGFYGCGFAASKTFTGAAGTFVVDAATLYNAVNSGLTVSGAGTLLASMSDGLSTRVSTQFDKVNATLANVTGLSATVIAGKSYRFEAVLFVDADVTGGSKYAIAGTATATAIVYEITLLSDATNLTTISARQTALAGASGQAGTTAGIARITGLITVNAAGTLTVQFAQNAANGTSSVLVGSHFIVSQVA